jgi:tetratricopeptide (TPR) repeat protein
MTLAEYYDRVINWPDQTGLAIGLGAGLAILCIAALLLAIGKVRRFARGLGIVGLLVLMAFVWVVHSQTITEKQGPRLTVTTMRYSPRIRQATTAALVGLPAIAAVVMSLVFFSTRRRLRAQVPRQLKAGRRHLVNKEYTAALREYNKAIEASPENAEAYFRRGSVLQAMGDVPHAIEDFDRAIDHDSRLAPAYLARAKIHTETGNLDLALADFEKLMAFRANDAESFLHRGICLLKKGFLGDAAADFQRVLKLTNHSDFAEPAKTYLHECQGPDYPTAPIHGANGASADRSVPETRAQELNS